MGESVESVLKYLQFLSKHFNKTDVDSVTVVLLMELGLDTSRIGFDNLKNAIILRLKDPTGMITKSLYPAVGRLYEPKVDKDQIERTIRYTVTEAWKERDPEVWDRFFPPDGEGKGKKPTNAEFITRIARFLEIWQNWSDEDEEG